MQYDPNESVTSGGGLGSTTGAPGSMSTAGDAGIGGTGTTTPDRATHGTAREKASQFKATLADKLEQGAQKIRERAHRESTGRGTLGAADVAEGTTSYAKTGERKLERAGESIAHGMESTANWVRNADMEKVKGDVEQQVRANPGRALLVALGVGYLLGKVFRGGGPRA
jgi:hypothetical protein